MQKPCFNHLTSPATGRSTGASDLQIKIAFNEGSESQKVTNKPSSSMLVVQKEIQKEISYQKAPQEGSSLRALERPC